MQSDHKRLAERAKALKLRSFTPLRADPWGAPKVAVRELISTASAQIILGIFCAKERGEEISKWQA
jgi:hypothetical protein